MNNYEKNFKWTTKLKKLNRRLTTLQRKDYLDNILKISLSLVLLLLTILFFISFFHNLFNPDITKIITSGNSSFIKNKLSKKNIINNVQKNQTTIIAIPHDKITINTIEIVAQCTSKLNKINNSQIYSLSLNFTFYDKLTQQNVIVDIGNLIQKKYRPTYILQVASYLKLRKANIIRAKLILIGISSTLNYREGCYHIDVEPFYRKREGDIINYKLQTEGVYGNLAHQVEKRNSNK